MPKSKLWSQVDQLINDQKFEEARTLVVRIREEAQKNGDGAQWTEALVKDVQLQIGLHGYETAVRFLREQKWPADPLSQLTLELYYARTLMTYEDAYSWEIGQREKVESKNAVDLKAWTKDEIFVEAQKAYARVWAQRAQLSKVPVAELKDYLNPGNYPAHIRGTLRDAVSYLAVELLMNTSNWRPQESAEVYRLDFKALLGGSPSRSGQFKLDDPAVHPIERALAVLDDLETWHAQEGQKEAALAARLHRIERMQAAFTEAAERQLLRAHLEQLLPQYRSLEWWAVGQAQLAEMVRDIDGDLVRAHALAIEGEKAYPRSHGGQRCTHLARAIEAPDFQVAAMAVDALNQRSMQISHKNMGALYFRAYEVDLQKRVETAKDYSLLLGYQDMRALLERSKPAAEWTLQLPATPDYKQHLTYVTPPLKKRGLYAIAVSARPEFKEESNRVLAVNFVISDLVLIVRQEGGAEFVTVVAGSTGQPVAGANVHLYEHNWNGKHRRLSTQQTDKLGVVKFAADQGSGRSTFLLADKAGDVTVDPQSTYLYREGEPGTTQASLVFTDRSIYRPQQKLFWKAVAYSGKGSEARYKVEPKAKLTVLLRDPNNQEVEKVQVTTNASGSAAGEFTIPTGRLLGAWRIEVQNYTGSAGIRVEEYKRPTFEVSLKDPDTALRLNRPATLVGEARYYFGLPVASGAIKWRVTREPVLPWWWSYWGWGMPQGGGVQTVATGSAQLQPDGTFKIEFTPEADEKKGKDLTYRYAVNADLTDEGGETRSAKRSFRLGFVSIEATLSTAAGFLRQGHVAATPITVRRASLDGVPRKGEGSYRVLALKQPGKTPLPAEVPNSPPPTDGKQPFQTPGDALRPRWSGDYNPDAHLARLADGKEISRGTLRHDEQGQAKITLTELQPGPYRVRYETTDEFGNKAEAWKDFIVAAAETPLAVPIILQVEQSSVRVGEVARLFAATGIVDQPLFLDIFRAGKLVERRVVGTGSTQAPELIEIPITEASRGGFALTLWGVRDHQFMTQSATVQVPWDNKELQIAFSTFRDKMRPGGKETWRVTVKDPAGKPLGANMVELLAYMYDRSLDLFAPHHPPSAMSLYPSRAQLSWARANLGTASLQWLYSSDLVQLPPQPSLSGPSLMFFDSYGIGGPGIRGGFGGGRFEMRAMAMPVAAAPGGMPPPAPPPPPPAQAPAPTTGAREKTETASTTPPDEKPKEAAARGPSAGGEGGGEVQLRSNFAETAFWRPNLLTEKDGSATIEFTVPDSVTAWNVWVHAVTQDLSGGSLKKESRSVKDLMVRPYLPRFFREGDRADLKVVVNNAGDKPLAGVLTLDVQDADSQESRAKLFALSTPKQPFSVEPGKGATLTFPIVAPSQVGTYAFKVTATAGDQGDGELRPLPVLPSRMHLAQSRFVTLKDKDQRTLTFEDLRKNDDPSRINEQLVVTLDAQLFYTVLKALPYLVNYPYECVEQTLNRFVSTGIVTSLYGSYPQVAKMAEEFSKRPTQLEKFDASDPNRKMTLEESPWLQVAQGGQDQSAQLLNVLNPRIALAQRDSALARLRKVQTSIGGFPWFPGGPPSPFMTLYLMSGFAKATEFKVEVPKDMVQRGWQYLARHFREEYAGRMQKDDCCWEFLTLLNYVATAYPDASWTGDALTLAERKSILEFSFKHWKQHSPYLKGLLALTLHRMGRPQDAKLVWSSVMDSAKTAPDQGTFWAQEDRSWLWYNDTIESHAFALRTLMELDPQSPKKDGLVLWLLINKKLNQWKSTRATAEVIYSLAHYLKKEGALGIREEATVRVGQEQEHFAFEPDKYVGKTQVIIPGSAVDRDPVGTSTISVQKPTKGVMFASATWHFSTEKLPAEGRGDFFQISRSYFRRENNGKEFVLQPIGEGTVLQPGDEVEVQISLRSKHAAEYVHLRDPRAAGLEPENAVSRYKWDLGIGFYEEVRDSGMNFFFEQLPAGEYTFKYRVRANLAGKFRVGPATIQSMYAPEFVGYSAGHLLTVAPGK